MPINTVISLPLHVRNSYLVQVVAKVVGEVCVQEGGTDTKSTMKNGRLQSIRVPRPFDPTQPASHTNSWSIDFARSYKGLGIDVSSNSKVADHGTLEFVDACGNGHSWFFHAEDEFEVAKTLRPGNHGFAVAVGRRVVKFFGGQLNESDARDIIALKVPNSRAKFPKKLASQSSNDRWYQFHNALHAEPMLTASELKAAMEEHGGNKGHQELLEYLQRLENRDHLEEVMPQAATGRSKPRM